MTSTLNDLLMKKEKLMKELTTLQLQDDEADDNVTKIVSLQQKISLIDISIYHHNQPNIPQYPIDTSMWQKFNEVIDDPTDFISNMKAKLNTLKIPEYKYVTVLNSLCSTSVREKILASGKNNWNEVETFFIETFSNKTTLIEACNELFSVMKRTSSLKRWIEDVDKAFVKWNKRTETYEIKEEALRTEIMLQNLPLNLQEKLRTIQIQNGSNKWSIMKTTLNQLVNTYINKLIEPKETLIAKKPVTNKWEYKKQEQKNKHYNIESNIELDNDITMPITIDGHELVGVLDTGATRSCIPLQLVKELQLIEVRKEGKVKTANGISQRYGTTTKLPTKFNGKDLAMEFEITPEDDEILIGLDLFRLGGLGIQGIVPFPTMENTTFKNCLTDKCESSDYDFDDKQIEMEIDLNKSISPYSVCSLNSAIISLKTTSDKICYTPQYPIKPQFIEKVDETVNNWLENGRISIAPEPGSPYNNALWAVPKTDDKGNKTGVRVCNDMRKLNQILQDDHFPIPCIESLLRKLEGSKIFSCLDLKDSYHQFPLSHADKMKTAFTWNGQQYIFNVCPFGLKNMTAAFQRVMTQILRECSKFIIVYIDDIVVFSKSKKEHDDHLKKVLQCINKANLRLNLNKCKFYSEEVDILGFKISKYGQQIQNRKLSAILDWEKPTNGKGIQRFLGFVNYCRKFIPNYAKISAPLVKLQDIKTISNDQWNIEAEQAFQELKSIVATKVMLHFPVENVPLEVETDASNFAVGAVLLQTIDGERRIIQCASRTLKGSEKNYQTTKRELLAVVFALEAFQEHLYGKKFVLFTDHKPLTYLWTKKNPSLVLTSWMDTIQEYDFTITYKKGSANILADALSRKQIKIYRTTKNGQKRKGSPINDLTQDASSKNEVKTVCNDEEKVNWLKRAHSLGHVNYRKMMQLLDKKGIYWRGMGKDARNYCRNCVPCMEVNYNSQSFHPLSQVSSTHPMKNVQIDLITTLPNSKGHKAILTVVDVFTKMTFLVALKSKSAEEVSKKLAELFLRIVLWRFPLFHL